MNDNPLARLFLTNSVFAVRRGSRITQTHTESAKAREEECPQLHIFFSVLVNILFGNFQVLTKINNSCPFYSTKVNILKDSIELLSFFI